ncbi:uncharacterized protein BCR38DRAFT_419462 [Pseudomassariella vexata]|uniref:Uncharacterized protein n=1 Tax=Pseudomassariella vexata TaxID=1141098 RepID=A0A1Y2EDS9_9PEZI|nr:uncharacterized protein BCR38DRAFT_419462 [Pseudomassariella vexata]ORY69567.1 hypothetical protein BCR38DRAFT_419462 [Pseudomassariella vexata]
MGNASGFQPSLAPEISQIPERTEDQRMGASEENTRYRWYQGHSHFWAANRGILQGLTTAQHPRLL